MAIAKVIHNNFKTNDGESVPLPAKGVMDSGKLTLDSKYDNETIFNRGNKPVVSNIPGMESWQPSVNLDNPGFDASGGQIRKNDMPYGEAAMFNQLPPGHDIDNQSFAVINNMPLRLYSGGVTFPGDTPWPVRDVPE
jgi:hypothetical protein